MSDVTLDSATDNKEKVVDQEMEIENLDEGTPAQDSIKAKSVVMATIMSQMAGMDHKDVTKIAGILNQVGHEADKLPDRANAGSNKHSVDAVGDAKSATMFSVKEDIAKMFGDDAEGLSEEFLDKVTTLFEAALNMRVAVEREAIMEEAADMVQELNEMNFEKLEEKVNDYLDYVITEWVEENKVPINSNLKTLQLEAFFEDLMGLMEDHNIDLPEDRLDVVDELMGEIEELKNNLNEQIERNIENQKVIDAARRDEIFTEVSEGLAATQVEKLKTLAEGIDFSDLDEYRKKVSTLKEHHFKDPKPVSNIKENIDNSDKNNEPEAKKPTGSMSRYSDAITSSLKR